LIIVNQNLQIYLNFVDTITGGAENVVAAEQLLQKSNMTEIFDNVLTTDEIEILLDWFNVPDELVDNRLDVISKSPPWTSHDWPKYLIKRVLDHVLPAPYKVEVVLFYGSRISFRLHVDSGDGVTQRPYKNVLIPLLADGTATTVVFDNYWHGKHTRFGKIVMSPFAYSLPNRRGEMQSVDDIRELLDQCLQNPNQIKDFEVTEKFVEQLKSIVNKRSGIGSFKPDDYVTDYKDIVNYKPNVQFDPELHEKYLNHLPIENLHGLTIEKIVEWQPGQAVTFDRHQLHAAGSGHQYKVGISIFTYY
jgi:hypothetical protein